MPASGYAVVLAASILDYFVVVFVLLGFTLVLVLQSRLFKKLEDAVASADRTAEVLEAITALESRTKPVTVDFTGAERRLEELLQATGRLEERLQLLLDREAPVSENARPVGLHGQIEQHLAAAGYHSVRIIGSLIGKDAGEHKVPVEVMKENVPHKGHIVLTDGRITAEKLLSIYEAFP